MNKQAPSFREWEEMLRAMPFVRLTIALLCGIIFQCSAAALSFPVWPISCLLACLCTGNLFFHFSRHPRYQWINGGWGILFLFSAGIAVVQSQNQESRLPLQSPIYIKAIVCEEGQEHDSFIKTFVKIIGYQDAEDRLINCCEKSVFYLGKDSMPNRPHSGDTLYAFLRLQPFSPPQLPEEFDYKIYMQRKGYFSSAFIRLHEYTIHKGSPPLLSYIGLLSRRAEKIFTDAGLEGASLAIMNALSLGDKNLLNPELKATYSATGASHILAVSGLHVGIIFAILSLALSFLGNSRKGQTFRNSFILAFLWAYAALVGFSPSVTRATLMFSFVLVGQLLQRDISIYNSLAASAFFICSIRPFDLFDTGFQLSYCAVLAIVYFQPHIYRCLYFRHKIVDYIWQLFSVSIAAQLGTLPITLYLFHQFPNYFLLTNLWVIPLTGIIIYIGVALLFFSWIPYLSTGIGWILCKALWLLNSGVHFIERLPHAVSTNIYLSTSLLWLATGVILCFALYLGLRQRRLLYGCAYFIVLFCGIKHYQTLHHYRQLAINVYNVKNSTYIHLIDGINTISLRDNKNMHQSFDFNLKSFFIARGIAGTPCTSYDVNTVFKDTCLQHLGAYHGFLSLGPQLIKVLNNKVNFPSKRIPIDYLIVTSAYHQSAVNALMHYLPQEIIIDSSVPTRQFKEWSAIASAMQLPLRKGLISD